MRFAIFTGHYPPHIGGVERYVRELASGVTARGHDCWIVTNNTDRAPAEEENGGIRISRLPVWNLFSGYFPVTLPSWRLVRCLRALRRWRPDWVVTNTRFFPINVIAALANDYLHGTKHLHIEHGSGHIGFPSSALTKCSRAYDRLAARLVVRKATLCVGVSRAAALFVETSSSRPCDGVLHNAVNAHDIALSGTTFREELGIGTGEIVFGFAGRLVHEKGVLEAMSAFRTVCRNRDPDRAPMRLVIAGAGPLEDEVARWAREDPAIHYLGQLKEKEMGIFYRTIDIFVYPTSCPEGFPTVILESGAYRKLVITTERGSMREAIPDASFGRIVPEHDRDALVNAMADYALRCHELRPIGETLRNHVSSHFTWERTVLRFLDLVGAPPRGEGTTGEGHRP